MFTPSVMHLPKKIVHSLRIELFAILDILEFGYPNLILQFGGGIGDELLLTTVAHELRQRDQSLKIWQVSHSHDLLANNPDYSRVFDLKHWYLKYSFFLKMARLRLAYAQEIIPREKEMPPSIHILGELCRKAKIKGDIAIRPYYYFATMELEWGVLSENQIAIQCCSEDSYSTSMKNKLWSHERFQVVVDNIISRYKGKFKVVQVGGSNDTLLNNVIDMRGKTNIRETASILANSRCFIGTVGFLMHLARAVNCRSVIIYGGREHSAQTGYICNENLNTYLPCAPCWQWNACDYERACMKQIEADAVLVALDLSLKKSRTALETEFLKIQ